MRRFLTKRTLFIIAAVILVVSLSAIGGLYLYINSPTFNQRLRTFIVQKIAAYTGTKVSLGSMHWSLREQRVVLDDMILRGNEPASSPPLVLIESVRAGVNFRSLLYRRLDLFELHIVNPEIRFNVDSQGRTSLPTPKPPEEGPESQFVVSIQNLRVTGGKAFINDQQSNIDFAISNLKSDLKYGGDTRTFSANLSYDGTLKPTNKKAVPYTLASEFDFTEGTILAKSVKITTGKSSASFQGRIDKVLTPDIAGKVEYTANLDSALLKDFIPEHASTGGVLARGALQFSSGKFSTNGDLSSREIALDGWTARLLKARYAYQYPMKQLSLTRVTTQVLDGSAEGKLVIDHVPGNPHITANLMYTGIDVAQLARVYPWDPKYVVFSRAAGELHGWFEGRLERYEFDGDSFLTSYRPSETAAGIVALPVDGTVAFGLTPGETTIKRSDLRFMNSSLTASGRITGKTQADLVVNLASTNLADFRFIYPDANGQGSFKGTLKGAVDKPVIEGTISLDRHKYREWTIQHAEGGVKLDTGTQLATLRNISARLGESTATLSGTASLDGKVLDLQIHSDHVRPEDFESITKEKIGGILSGDVHLTSLDPIKVSGHVAGLKLSARGHTFDKVEAGLTYNEPVLQLQNVTASEGDAHLTARTIDYNKTTGTVRFVGEVTSLALDRLREFGVPETLNGTISRARIQVTGTQDRPQIQGDATVENLTFRGETFPLANVGLTTNWPKLNVTVSGIENVSLTASVDVAATGYPFEASAKFEKYSVEKLANFSQGTLSVSGDATFRGQLKGEKPLSGEGTIRRIDARIRDVEFHNANPFEFALEPNRIRLDKEATFSGAYGTKVNLKGAIGLATPTTLDLEVRGDFDLSEIAAATEDWSIAGTVALNGRVNGTATNPAINGLLTISNASLGREGFFTTLSGLNGNLRFDANRVNFENLRGKVGLGEVQFRGSALIRNAQLEGMDIRVEVLKEVSLRYPKDLRSSVTGALSVTGSSSSPLVSGDLKLNRMSYTSPFESFLAIFRAGGLDSGGNSMLDRVRLAVHVAGNRNITVKNELADIGSANVDLQIRGTWGSPSMIGHIEVSEGTILFQGKKYEVTRGNIDFVNPLKIEPVVDIQAETDVRDYRVLLIISGKGDRIRATFSTDPPLPGTEVVSLVAGGKTRDELQGSSSPSSEQLFQEGAKNIVAGQLLSNVGRRFGFSGLDWIRFDPQFQTNTNNPSLRMTITQQVSKDLAVTYSQDLASTQQRVVTVEYYLSRNLSIVASREETNEASALGLDIKLRRRY